MKPVILTTWQSVEDVSHQVSLLILDDHTATAAAMGEQVRNLIDVEPLIRTIYVAAPLIGGQQLQELLVNGLPVVRASAKEGLDGPQFYMLDLHTGSTDGELRLRRLSMMADAGASVTAGEWTELEPEVMEGWLIHLFRSRGAMVHAPHGVHFGKSSGKHSKEFLRTSSTLMSTATCGLLAMVTLSKVRNLTPRRIFVDTAPLLAVAYSMFQVASVRGLWDLMPPAHSFSSYGGIGQLPSMGLGDLVLVSASTSGGLANEMIIKGVHADMLATLFFRGTSDNSSTPGELVCDLMGRLSKVRGFLKLDSFDASNCRFCQDGDVLAELQGDQFLIDQRQVKRLRLVGDTQLKDARAFFTNVCRTSAIRLRVNESSSRFTRFELSEKAVFSDDGSLGKDFARLLSRFAPLPLHYIVTAGVTEDSVRACLMDAGLNGLLEFAEFVDANKIETISEVKEIRNFLVLFSVLEDHSLARTINAALRAKSYGGNVTYISGLVISSSARAAEDLRIFLTFGSRGPDTYTFKTVKNLLMPYIAGDVSPWGKERVYLQNLSETQRSIPIIAERLGVLSNAGTESDNLFLSGQNGRLAIRPDFVFLDTLDHPEAVSHADVLAVVGNVLACARAGKDNVSKAPPRGTPIWKQTSLYQVLLCPSNFQDYNDPILKAALLRSADEQELNYAVDDTASEEMLSIVSADISRWKNASDSGDALPEFLLALSTGRFRLTAQHAVQLRATLVAAQLPEYLVTLASEFVNPSKVSTVM